MNAKVLISLVVGLLLGFPAGWFVASRGAGQERAGLLASLDRSSNSLAAAESRLTLQQTETDALRQALTRREGELTGVSNRLGEISRQLDQAGNEARAAATSARQEIETRDQRITTLESEKDVLTEKINGLSTEITTLNQQIAETERKLTASEGDRTQLQRELRKLLAEKSDLERSFNSLAALRQRVLELRQEIAAVQQEPLLRRTYRLFERKGAQLLVDGIRPSQPRPPEAPYKLDAEVGTDGSSKINSPAP